MLPYERIGDVGRRGVPQKKITVGFYAGAVQLAVREILNDFKRLLAREVVVAVQVHYAVDDGDATAVCDVLEELLPCGSEFVHVVTSDADVVTSSRV